MPALPTFSAVVRASLRPLLTLLMAGSSTWVHAAAPTDTLAQRLAACVSCHAREEQRDAYFPRIAGKPAGYLYQQLLNFRDGRRNYPLMTYMVAHQSDAYLAEMAEYFSRLTPSYPPLANQPSSGNAAQLVRGRTLVESGDAERKIPACNSCHGAQLSGVQPAIPGLLGLTSDYINAQFGAWRNHSRRAAAPDCMAQIAERLSLTDVAAISQWLSRQPVAPSAHPAPRPAQPLPMACGSMQAQPAPARADSAEQQRSRGAYLAQAADCMACHTARAGAPYGGGRALATPFGTMYAPNITPDQRHGIGNWTADDFWRALHHGVSKDGRLLYPAFPYTNYTRMPRADSDALFAYLRSLPAANTANLPHQLRFPYNQQLLLAGWRALYFRPGEYRPDPSKSVEWNRGAYLVQGPGHCSACHSPRNWLGASEGETLAGALMPMQGWYAPALAAPHEAGLQHWPQQRIVQLLKTGIGTTSAGTVAASVSGPMAEVVRRSLQYLHDEDVRAIAQYLQTLPLTGSKGAPEPARSVVLPAFLAAGEKLYRQHCADCHGSAGQGQPPAYPPLAGNRAITMAHNVNPIRMVLNGGFAPATAGNPRPYSMPPYGPVLSDLELAQILTYVRTSWGNQAAPVSASDVNQYRSVPLD